MLEAVKEKAALELQVSEMMTTELESVERSGDRPRSETSTFGRNL